MSSVDSLTTVAGERGKVPAASRKWLGGWALDIPSDDEEWANGLSHAVGCLLSIGGAVLLWRHIGQQVALGVVVSCGVYITALISVYAASTLSHWVREPVWRRRFRSWDQGLIYVLITGTYTPFAAAYFHGAWHFLTVLMWTLALLGFISKVAFEHRVNGIALWLYLALGWLPILALPHLLASAPFGALALVLGGGLAYTLGSVILKYDDLAPYLHVGWHLSVILGSGLHFCAVWHYVIAALPSRSL